MTGRRLQAVVRRNAGPTRSPLVAGGSPRRRTYNKFHVAPKPDRTWNGIVFASKGEMERHRELLKLHGAGKIVDLERQVPLVLFNRVDGKSLLKWVVDWRYVENGQIIVEDFTGVMTSLKRSNIRICAEIYPEFTIRVSSKSGNRIVIVDCVKGKVPVKKRTKPAKASA